MYMYLFFSSLFSSNGCGFCPLPLLDPAAAELDERDLDSEGAVDDEGVADVDMTSVNLNANETVCNQIISGC